MKVTVAGNYKKSIGEMLSLALVEAAVSIMLSAGLILSILGICKIECDLTQIVASGFNGNSLANGIYHFYNLAAESLGRNTSILLTPVALLSEETAVGDMVLMISLVTVVLAVCAFVLLKLGSALILVPFGAAALYSVCADTNGNPYGKLLLLSGVFFLALYFSYFGNRKKPMANGYRLILMGSVLVFLMASAGCWAVETVFPEDEYEVDGYFLEIQDKVKDYIEEIRFGKADTNTLPKGDLENAHIWEGSDKTALKVTMSQPESMYLRGFVGSVYDENQWKDLERSAYYENKDLFYWLLESGFSGDKQLSSLRTLLEETDLAKEKLTVRVENVNADRQYLYTTYEMTNLDAQVEGNNGASYQKSKEFFGTETYSFETYANLVKDFPQMAAEGYLYKASHNEAAYVEAESHYNVFVYDNYTELPASLNTYFKTQLGYAGDKEKGHVNYYSAIEKIRTYLNEHMTCGNYGEELPEGEDFAEYFLKESKIGNPVHFATAAALMFRYYGIPSRYVEGYLITPEDVKGLSGEATIEVAGKNGHAWVEIYVDGLGWVPVEMTPDYYEVMEEPDFKKGLEADSTVVLKEPPEEEDEPKVVEESDLKYKLVGFFLDLAKILLTILLVFDGFCILFFLYSVARRIYANGKRKKAFKNPDHRLAVQSMTGYMRRLINEIEGIDEENEEWMMQRREYEAAYRIGEKAAFSLHDITTEERKQVETCKDNLLILLKKQKGWFEKWVLKYIERLY